MSSRASRPRAIAAARAWTSSSGHGERPAAGVDRAVGRDGRRGDGHARASVVLGRRSSARRSRWPPSSSNGIRSRQPTLMPRTTPAADRLDRQPGIARHLGGRTESRGGHRRHPGRARHRSPPAEPAESLGWSPPVYYTLRWTGVDRSGPEWSGYGPERPGWPGCAPRHRAARGPDPRSGPPPPTPKTDRRASIRVVLRLDFGPVCGYFRRLTTTSGSPNSLKRWDLQLAQSKARMSILGLRS
jgi:hypothetical protein